MAVTTRKGHAASVRRQSRQRLRSDRRYRRNRFLRFYRHLVRTGSAFPRLPRRFAPRNDNSEVHTILTMACTDRQHCAGHGCPLPYNGVYNRREYPEICSCQRRSLTAATDALGAYRFHGGRYESAALRQERHAAPLQRANSCLAQLRIFVKMYLTFREQADIIKMWKPRRLPQT